MEGGEDILVAMMKMLECFVNVSTTQTLNVSDIVNFMTLKIFYKIYVGDLNKATHY